jgi:hypothetical protein
MAFLLPLAYIPPFVGIAVFFRQPVLAWPRTSVETDGTFCAVLPKSAFDKTWSSTGRLGTAATFKHGFVQVKQQVLDMTSTDDAYVGVTVGINLLSFMNTFNSQLQGSPFSQPMACHEADL